MKSRFMSIRGPWEPFRSRRPFMGWEHKKLGLVLGSSMPPEQLVPAAIEADELGLDELWFSEDCFFTGGVSGAAPGPAAAARRQGGAPGVAALRRHPVPPALRPATMVAT